MYINTNKTTGEFQIFEGEGADQRIIAEGSIDLEPGMTHDDVAEAAMRSQGLRTSGLYISAAASNAQPIGWVTFFCEAEDVAIETFKVGVPHRSAPFSYFIGDLVDEDDLSQVYTVDTMAEARKLMQVIGEGGKIMRHQAAEVAAIVRDELDAQGIFDE